MPHTDILAPPAAVQGFSHNIMHVAVFFIYNCGYPYCAFLYTANSSG